MRQIGYGSIGQRAVCKTVIRRFESGPHLRKNSSVRRRAKWVTRLTGSHYPAIAPKAFLKIPGGRRHGVCRSSRRCKPEAPARYRRAAPNRPRLHRKSRRSGDSRFRTTAIGNDRRSDRATGYDEGIGRVTMSAGRGREDAVARSTLSEDARRELFGKYASDRISQGQDSRCNSKGYVHLECLLQGENEIWEVERVHAQILHKAAIQRYILGWQLETYPQNAADRAGGSFITALSG